MANMKTLPKIIKADGFTMVQVMREDDLAIYRRTKQVGDGSIEHFEVAIIRAKPESRAFGLKFPAYEKYPSSEEWGLYGFTCHDLDAAWLRVKKIRAEREAKTP